MQVLDVAHRATVLGLAGITCWGLWAGASVHFNILAAGKREYMCELRSERDLVDD